MDDRHGLVLRTVDRAVLEEVVRAKAVAPLIGPRIDEDTFAVSRGERGRLKQALLKLGWPAEDRAGYVAGAPYDIQSPTDWALRPYQEQAVSESPRPAAVSWSFPAERARPSSGWRRWPPPAPGP